MKKNIKNLGTSERPRLVVYRSLKYIHAQLVDDSTNSVLLGLMDKSDGVKSRLKNAKTKTETANIVGKVIAEKAIEKNIKKIVFDRNGYVYHGRIKALAEGAREGGLEF